MKTNSLNSRILELTGILQTAIQRSRQHSEVFRGKNQYYDNPILGQVNDLQELHDLLIDEFDTEKV